MKIIYMAGIYSSDILEWGFKNCKNFSQVPGSKFHKLVLEGLRKKCCQDAICVSNIPFRSSDVENDLFFKESNENGVEYFYPPFHKKRVKNLLSTVKFYEKILKNKLDKDSIIICDVLNASMCYAALKYARKKKIKCYGIVTDLAYLLPSDGTFKQKIVKKYTMNQLKKFDGYIFLTEYMNEKININKRPYVIVECIVDYFDEIEIKKKCNNRIIYAGGINKEYGIPELIEGFIKADLNNYELHLFGKGNCFEQYDSNYLKEKHVFLRGLAPNDIVVREEKDAILLVNPRSPYEEFTKYSFPSKNMEYMISGTAMAGFKLPGIPDDYDDKFFLFNDFSSEGIAETFKKLFLNLSDEDFIEKGRIAQEFVFKNKNKYVVGEKIFDNLLNK